PLLEGLQAGGLAGPGAAAAARAAARPGGGGDGARAVDDHVAAAGGHGEGQGDQGTSGPRGSGRPLTTAPAKRGTLPGSHGPIVRRGRRRANAEILVRLHGVRYGRLMEPSPLYVAAFGLCTTLGLFVLLRLGQRVLGASVRADLTKGSSARRLLQVGQVLGVFLVASSAVKGSLTHRGVLGDVIDVATHAVVALVLMMITGHLGVRALLRSRLPAELARGNVAAGVAAGA